MVCQNPMFASSLKNKSYWTKVGINPNGEVKYETSTKTASYTYEWNEIITANNISPYTTIIRTKHKEKINY